MPLWYIAAHAVAARRCGDRAAASSTPRSTARSVDAARIGGARGAHYAAAPASARRELAGRESAEAACITAGISDGLRARGMSTTTPSCSTRASPTTTSSSTTCAMTRPGLDLHQRRRLARLERRRGDRREARRAGQDRGGDDRRRLLHVLGAVERALDGGASTARRSCRSSTTIAAGRRRGSRRWPCTRTATRAAPTTSTSPSTRRPTMPGSPPRRAAPMPRGSSGPEEVEPALAEAFRVVREEGRAAVVDVWIARNEAGSPALAAEVRGEVETKGNVLDYRARTRPPGTGTGAREDDMDITMLIDGAEAELERQGALRAAEPGDRRGRDPGAGRRPRRRRPRRRGRRRRLPRPGRRPGRTRGAPSLLKAADALEARAPEFIATAMAETGATGALDRLQRLVRRRACCARRRR